MPTAPHLVERDLESLRAQALLYVIVTNTPEGSQPPSQFALMGGGEGLLNKFWKDNRVEWRYPTGFTSNSHINRASHLLAEQGYIVERGRLGDDGRRTTAHYTPTDAGRTYVAEHLSGKDWTDWPDDLATPSEGD